MSLNQNNQNNQNNLNNYEEEKYSVEELLKIKNLKVDNVFDIDSINNGINDDDDDDFINDENVLSSINSEDKNSYEFFKKNKLNLNLKDNFKNNETFKENDIMLNLNAVTLTLITSEGYISNISYIEKEFIKTVKLSKRIIKIQSNYGDILINANFDHLLNVKEIKPKRGRKPIDKKKTKRKQQGEERGFHSQIEFFFYNPDINNKIFRIKLFVNGRIQIPGVKNEKFEDVQKIIAYFIRYINKFKEIKVDKTKKCEFKYITSVMENYKTNIEILNPSLLKSKVNLDFEILKKLFDSYKDVLQCKYEISVINHSYESPRFIIKFKTPIPENKKAIFEIYKPNYKKKNKETTLILFASGKININGGNNRIESTEIIEYVYKIIKLHAREAYYINI